MAGEEDTIASEVIAASLGGAVSASLLYPLEVLKTKMQAQGGDDDNDDNDQDGQEEESNTKTTQQQQQQKQPQKSVSMIQYAQQLYDKEGAQVFFRGMETSAFQSATEKALYFFAYQALKDIHAALTGSTKLDGLSNLLLGCAAEWAHLPITLPLDCWTTLIQTSTNPNDTPMALLCTLLEAGPSKMYKGIQAYTVLCLKPALQYTIFEQVKTAMVAHRPVKSLGAIEAFVLGMVARTIATVVVFPYLRAKVLLQASKSTSTCTTSESTTTNSKPAAAAATSIPSMLATMYQQGGLASWFQGLGPELTRGVLSAALMLMIKEKISILVKELIVGHAEKKKLQAQQQKRTAKY